jgi:hypothetical protein
MLFVIRFEIGWYFQPQFIVLFVILASFGYLGSWMIFPSGRKLIQNYWKFGENLFFGWYAKKYKVQAISEEVENP